ncbi:MAG: DUF21 domain-containing protein [Ruminococcaceae bacterium]|nr:DUF21 domain-containing protein [Oscillospiraceae bacterium]
MESNKKEDIPKRKKKPMNWAIKATLITLVISFFLGIFADVLSKNLNFVPALLVLIFIILVGVFSDMAGIAIATADEKTLNAMAARKIRGAKEALLLLRNAEKATSIFNDVIGDIAGIISGATGATIGVYLIGMLKDVIASGNAQLGELLTLSMLSALIASMTVGGKAAGKKYAIKNAEKIVYFVGKTVNFFKRITNVRTWFRKER